MLEFFRTRCEGESRAWSIDELPFMQRVSCAEGGRVAKRNMKERWEPRVIWPMLPDPSQIWLRSGNAVRFFFRDHISAAFRIAPNMLCRCCSTWLYFPRDFAERRTHIKICILCCNRNSSPLLCSYSPHAMESKNVRKLKLVLKCLLSSGGQDCPKIYNLVTGHNQLQ